MPFKSIEEVPDSVPQDMREQWMKIWNSTFEKTSDEEAAFKAANEILDRKEMADFNNNWVEVFKAGDYGDKGQWTENDIDKMVANFSTGDWKPPAVLGHPKTDSPAMGWVSELQRQGKILVAKFSQVQPELESLVSGGRFPNRSAAFYTDPKGNGPVLRHVGFLGATPPEVKGLAPVKFSSDEFTSINFQEEGLMPDNDKKSIKEAVAEFFAEMFGRKPDTSQATFSEAQMNEAITAAVTAATKPLIEANKQLSTDFSELQKTLKDGETNSRKSKAANFVEGLKKSGKWIPAYDQMGIPALLEQAAVTGGTVKFGEGDKQKEVGSFEQMCAFLEGLPAAVPIGDITGKRKSASGKVVQFNEAKGVDLDMDSVALNERAEAIASEKKIDFGEALQLAAEELSA